MNAEIMGAGGYLVTQAITPLLERSAHNREAALINAHGPVGDTKLPSSRQWDWRHVSSRLLSAFAISGGITAGLVPQAFFSQTVHHQTNIQAELVVDKSGQELFNGSEPVIDQITSDLIHSPNFIFNTITAWAGSTLLLGSNNANNIQAETNIKPTGSVSLISAFASASNYLAEQKQVAHKSIVVVTNNDSLGNSSQVIEAANADHEQLYIINVNPKLVKLSDTQQQAALQASHNLQSEAKESKGLYTEVSQSNAIGAAVQKIEKDIVSSNQSVDNPTEQRSGIWLKVLDVAALVVMLESGRKIMRPVYGRNKKISK